jgi:hypothetical protein
MAVLSSILLQIYGNKLFQNAKGMWENNLLTSHMTNFRFLVKTCISDLIKYCNCKLFYIIFLMISI